MSTDNPLRYSLNPPGEGRRREGEKESGEWKYVCQWLLMAHTYTYSFRKWSTCTCNPINAWVCG